MASSNLSNTQNPPVADSPSGQRLPSAVSTPDDVVHPLHHYDERFRNGPPPGLPLPLEGIRHNHPPPRMNHAHEGVVFPRPRPDDPVHVMPPRYPYEYPPHSYQDPSVRSGRTPSLHGRHSSLSPDDSHRTSGRAPYHPSLHGPSYFPYDERLRYPPDFYVSPDRGPYRSRNGRDYLYHSDSPHHYLRHDDYGPSPDIDNHHPSREGLGPSRTPRRSRSPGPYNRYDYPPTPASPGDRGSPKAKGRAGEPSSRTRPSQDLPRMLSASRPSVDADRNSAVHTAILPVVDAQLPGDGVPILDASAGPAESAPDKLASSSHTPHLAEHAPLQRRAARMKPESRAHQRKMLKGWKDAKKKPVLKRTERGLIQVFSPPVQSSVLESDDAGAGPLDPDDSMYRGSASRSRVATTPSSVATRLRTRAVSNSSPTSKVSPPSASAVDLPQSSNVQSASARKRARSASPSKSQDDAPNGTVDMLQVPSKTSQRRAPFDIPSASHSLDTFVAESVSTPDHGDPMITDNSAPPVSFVDDEASEDQDEDLASDENDDDVSDDAAQSGDEYDYADSFIDDGSVHSASSDSEDVTTRRPPTKKRRLKRKSSAKSPAPSRVSGAETIAQSSHPSALQDAAETRFHADLSLPADDGDAQPSPGKSAARHGKARARIQSPPPAIDATTQAPRTGTSAEDPRVDRSSSVPGALSSSTDTPTSVKTTPVPEPQAAPPLPSTPLSTGKMTMAQLAALHGVKSPSSSPSKKSSPAQALIRIGKGQYLRKCLNLPEKCEVTDPNLWDPLLASVYPTLPPLRHGTLIAWTEKEGSGQAKFIHWSEQCPDMPASLALQAVNFTGALDSRIRGLARMSPDCVLLRSVSGSNTRYNLYVNVQNPQPLVGYFAGYLEFSHLTAISDGPIAHRYIRVIGHTQEWERFVGFVTTATGFPKLHAQLGFDAMQFSTRAQGSGQSSFATAKAGKSKMFAGSSTATASPTSSDNFSLPNDVDVPVYDARNVDDSFDLERDIHRLATVLPRYTDGEIPSGSLVGVGSTMSIYRSGVGNMTLGCNILWVILFGSPAEEKDDVEEETAAPTSS